MYNNTKTLFLILLPNLCHDHSVIMSNEHRTNTYTYLTNTGMNTNTNTYNNTKNIVFNPAAQPVS